MASRPKPDVPYFHLTMGLDDLSVSLPQARGIPAGYGISLYRSGCDADWARIERLAGEFPDEDRALAHFDKEFGQHREQMEERCLFLHAVDGSPIGTATAWYGDRGDGPIGRLHWVAIVPAFQGRGLAKPLVAEALAILRRRHTRAYLTTQTTSWIAVKVYLDLGFRPIFDSPDSKQAWAAIAALLHHPALA